MAKKVLIIGVSYREDTNDTRHSPAEGVHDFFRKMGCRLKFYDPGVNYWEYTDNHSIEKKYLDEILLDGTQKADKIASEKVKKIQELVGF